MDINVNMKRSTSSAIAFIKMETSKLIDVDRFDMIKMVRSISDDAWQVLFSYDSDLHSVEFIAELGDNSFSVDYFTDFSCSEKISSLSDFVAEMCSDD